MNLSKRPLPEFLLAALLLGISEPSSHAAEPLPPVIERYEQMLARAPRKGAAFEKVIQHASSHGGLDALAARWRERATGENEAAYSFLLGLLAERQGKTEEARERYNRGLELQPEDPIRWATLAAMEAENNKLPEAAAAYGKALALPGTPADRAELYRALARVHQRRFDADALRETWGKMAAEFPADPVVLKEAGDALADAGRFDEAQKLYEAIRKLPESDASQRVTAILRLAKLEERRGKDQEALAVYGQVLGEVSSTNWVNREARAAVEAIFRRKNDLRGLAEHYRSWIEAHPRDGQAAALLASALIEQGQPEEAIEWAKKSAAWAPQEREQQADLARKLLAANQPEAAASLLSALQAAAPGEALYAELLGEAQWQLSRQKNDDALRDAALASWRRIAPENARDAALVLHLAKILREHRLTDEALAEYERAERLDPSALETTLERAGLLYDLKRRPEAVALLHAALQGERATAENFLRVAKWHQSRKDPAGALLAAENGLRIAPGNFDLLGVKLELLADARWWESALEMIDPLIAAAPSESDQERAEIRAVQILNDAGELARRKAGLEKELGGNATLSHLRLLVRAALATRDFETGRAALAEGQTRFPGSISLVRLEAGFYGEAGFIDEQVKTLRRLTTLRPGEAGECLAQIVEVYQRAGRYDEALAACTEFITRSPGNPQAHLLAAKVAFATKKPEEGYARLRHAIPLSSSPNEIRAQLARAYAENGDAANAAKVFDEIFESETDSQRRQEIVPAMAAQYQILGKADELITRLRKRQNGGGDDWRIALSIAEIFEGSQNFTAARKELEKALQQRPDDLNLLRKAAGLAKSEGNRTNEIRFLKKIEELEPLPANRAALFELYLQNSDTHAEALELIRKKPSEFLADSVQRLNLLGRFNPQGQVRSALVALMVANPPKASDSFQRRLFQAENEILSGELAKAKATLWSLLRTPPETASTPAASAIALGGRAARRSRSYEEFYARQNAANFYRTLAQNLLPIDNNRSWGMSPITPSPRIFKDAAAIYLGQIARVEKATEALWQELDKELASPEERILTRLLLDDFQAIESALGAWPESQSIPPELAALCANSVQNRLHNAKTDEEFERFVKLIDRLQKDVEHQILQPEYLNQIRFQRLVSQRRFKEARELFKQIAARVDRSNRDSLVNTMQQAVQIGAFDEALLLMDEISKLRGRRSQNLQWVLSSTLSPQENIPPDQEAAALKLTAKLLIAVYPDKPEVEPEPSNTNESLETFPRSRFVNRQIRWPFDALVQRSPGLAKKLLPILQEQIKTLPKDRQVYPRLLRVYLAHGLEEKDLATREAVELAKDIPEDEMRLLAAGLLVGRSRAAEALPLLKEATSAAGGEAVRRELLLLQCAAAGKSEKDKELARETVARLARFGTLGHNERRQVAALLADLGLDREVAAASAGASPEERIQMESEAMQRLAKARRKEEAVASARRLLDPAAASPTIQNYYNWNRIKAVEVLQEMEALPAYIKELNDKLAKEPNSAKLHYLMAEANSAGGNTAEKVNTSLKAPLWLKLVRSGNKVSGYTSTDGEQWKLLGETTLQLPDAVEVGIAATGKSRKEPLTAVIDSFSFQPGLSNEGWKQREIGKTGKAGSFKVEADGSATFTAYGSDIYGTRDSFFFASRPMSGDGELKLRIRSVNKSTPVKLGLMFRAGDGANAINAAIVFRGNDGVGFQYREFQPNFEPSLRKLMELEPDNKLHAIHLAGYLADTSRNGEAIALIEPLLAEPAEEFANRYYPLVRAYKEEGKLEHLAKRLMEWPPGEIVRSGGNWNAMGMLERTAQECLTSNLPELTVQLCRKGLEIPNASRRSNSRILLARGLSTLNQHEAAAEAMMPILYSEEANQPPEWANSFSAGDRGVSSSTLSAMLDLDSKTVALIAQRLETALEKSPQSRELGTISLLTGIRVRNEAVLSRLPAVLERLKESGQPNQGEVIACLEMARLLRGWQGQEKLALEVFRSLSGPMSSRGFLNYGYQPFLCEWALAEWQQGEQEAAFKAMSTAADEIIAGLEKQPSPGERRRRSDFNADRAVRLLALMIITGDRADYVRLLEKARALAPNPKFGGWTLDEEAKQFAGTSDKFQALPWLTDETEDGPNAKITFEIRGAHPYDQKEVSSITQSRARSNPALEKKRTLRFLYGRSPEEMKPLGNHVTTAAFGTWHAPVPQGEGFLRIVMTETGTGKTAEISSPAVHIVRGPNLVENAGFDGLEKRPNIPDPAPDQQGFAIPGWTNLPYGYWKIAQDGPCHGGRHVHFFAGNGKESLIAGSKIAIEPGKTYFQSAWLRSMDSWDCRVQYGRRYLDAEGKELKISFISAYNAFNWRRHWQKLVPREGLEGELIPEGTAFIQPILKVRGGAEWTSLYLTTLPTPAAE